MSWTTFPPVSGPRTSFLAKIRSPAASPWGGDAVPSAVAESTGTIHVLLASLAGDLGDAPRHITRPQSSALLGSAEYGAAGCYVHRYSLTRTYFGQDTLEEGKPRFAYYTSDNTQYAGWRHEYRSRPLIPLSHSGLPVRASAATVHFRPRPTSYSVADAYQASPPTPGYPVQAASKRRTSRPDLLPTCPPAQPQSHLPVRGP